MSNITIATRTARDQETRRLTQKFLDRAHSIGVTRMEFYRLYDVDGGYWMLQAAWGPTCHLEPVFDELDDLWFATTCNREVSLTMLTELYRSEVDDGRDYAKVHLDQPVK